MKKIVLLGCGKNSLSLIKFLKSKNLFTIGIDKNKKAPGLKKVDYFLNIPCSNWKKIGQKLKKEKNIFFIACANGDPIISAAILNKKNKNLHLNINSAKILKKKTNYIKHYNFEINLDEKKLSVENLPFIVKKDNQSGGTGISIVKTKKDFKKFLNNKKTLNKKGLYIEKFLNATNYVITGVVFKNKLHIPALFKVELNKKFQIKNFVYENIYLEKYIEIIKYISKITKNLKINFGPVNFQIFKFKNKIYLAEIEGIFMGSGIIEKANKINNNNYELMLKFILNE